MGDADDWVGSPGANATIREQLRNHRDDGTAVRHVIHYAYVASDTHASIDEVGRLLKAEGFEIRPTVDNDGLVFEHHAAVAPPAFDALTAQLRRTMAQHGWDYDGWECEVVEGGLN